MKLLWVNAASSTTGAAAREGFEPHCEVEQVDLTDLAVGVVDGDWDVVCFDFDFPDRAGLRLVGQTKERSPSRPVVLLTAQLSAEIALWALRSRVFDVLVKPLGSEEILSALTRVHAALRSRRTQSERRLHAMAAPLPPESRCAQRTPVSSRLSLAVAYVS